MVIIIARIYWKSSVCQVLFCIIFHVLTQGILQQSEEEDNISFHILYMRKLGHIEVK